MTERVMRVSIVATLLFCAAGAILPGCGSMNDPDDDGDGQPDVSSSRLD